MEGTRLRADLISGGSVGIKAPTASPLVTKRKATAKRITLAPIQGASPLSSPAAENEAAVNPRSPYYGPQRLLVAPIPSPLKFPGKNFRPLRETSKDQGSMLPGSSSGKLQKSSSLPRLTIDPDLMGAQPGSPSVGGSSKALARGNALLLAPTASPLKLTRSRSVQLGEPATAIATVARQVLPFPTVRRTGPSGDLSDADLQALDRSLYYERKDTVLDVLMQWDYQTKSFVFCAH